VRCFASGCARLNTGPACAPATTGVGASGVHDYPPPTCDLRRGGGRVVMHTSASDWRRGCRPVNVGVVGTGVVLGQGDGGGSGWGRSVDEERRNRSRGLVGARAGR
jgi:hypothetical protein